MPLFVYSWPNGDFGLMSAADEDDAFEKLDEIADPGLVRLSRYNGPIFLEFTQENSPFGNDKRNKKRREKREGKLSKQQKYFADCFAQGKYTDVEIRVPHSEEIIKAHRLIIAQYPFFANLLARSGSAVLQIDADVSVAVMRAIVTWMYTKRFSLDNTYKFEVTSEDKQQEFDNLCKAALAAKRFGLTELLLEIEDEATVSACRSHSLTQPISFGPYNDDSDRRFLQELRKSVQWYQKTVAALQQQGLTGIAQALLDHVKSCCTEAQLSDAEASAEFIQKVRAFEKLDVARIDRKKLAKQIQDGSLLSLQYLGLGTDSSDDGSRMWDKIASLAFPRTAAAWKEVSKKYERKGKEPDLDDAEFIRHAQRLEKANDEDRNEMTKKAKTIEEGLAASNDVFDRIMTQARVTRDVFSGNGSQFLQPGGGAALDRLLHMVIMSKDFDDDEDDIFGGEFDGDDFEDDDEDEDEDL